MTQQAHRKLRRRLQGEYLEQRRCLSALTFVPHSDSCGSQLDSVHAADLDGDGDEDVLTAAYWNGTIWCENLDGKGTLGARQVIRDGSGDIVQASDLDGDGDLDVISAGYPNISWYENTDGQATFGPRQFIPGAIGTESLSVADMDGDGDLDVVTASYEEYAQYEAKVSWYENLDGQGTFGDRQMIAGLDGDDANMSAVVADVDGDGDLDVLSVLRRGDDDDAEYRHETVWYSNTDGNGTFSDEQLISTDTVWRLDTVDAADLDGDGDADLLANIGSWRENLDGQGNFGDERIAAEGARYVDAVDMDADGDLDIVAAGHMSVAGDLHSYIAWHENVDGQGTFGDRQFIATRLGRIGNAIAAWDIFVQPADLDGDGEVDLISSWLWWSWPHTSYFVWYESRVVGDVNGDGVFNSSDLVQVFQVGEYEDGIPNNSDFDEGDWDGDGEFTSSDLVMAHQGGHYERGVQSVPQDIPAAVDWWFAQRDKTRKSSATYVP
jgi:hypothetical protein